ncbi:hypothetical protein TALC_00790 [Thermoplasmatales archaeon BRNA1]|nr:hypothetical protein TALC_00790 [Thermoplasmatales archaeon BRNA1]
MPEEQKKPAKHICLTNRRPLGISSEPEADIIQALADPDVLAMVRGLSQQNIRAPFTGGAFGMEEKRVNAAVLRMKAAGLICSRRVDEVHEYYLNCPRLLFLSDWLREHAKDPGADLPEYD